MRRHLSLLFSITVACCWFSPGQEARAGGGPENLMLVVNADDPSSMLLANHYVRLRKIPPCNVVYLTGVPQSVDMALETFQVKIMTDSRRHLSKQVRVRTSPEGLSKCSPRPKVQITTLVTMSCHFRILSLCQLTMMLLPHRRLRLPRQCSGDEIGVLVERSCKATAIDKGGGGNRVIGS